MNFNIFNLQNRFSFNQFGQQNEITDSIKQNCPNIEMILSKYNKDQTQANLLELFQSLIPCIQCFATKERTNAKPSCENGIITDNYTYESSIEEIYIENIICQLIKLLNENYIEYKLLLEHIVFKLAYDILSKKK